MKLLPLRGAAATKQSQKKTYVNPTLKNLIWTEMNSRVLITDGHWRKAVAAVRALGRRGIDVTVGESTRLAAAAFSRYCRRAVVYPSPMFKPSGFADFIYKELSRRPYQMLLPMEDEPMALLSQHRTELSRLTYLPIVPYEKFQFARSKDAVLKLAESLGIPVPKTWYVDSIEQLHDLKARLPYPVVIKPRMSSGALGLCFPQNEHDFMQHYQAVHQRFPYPLIQEYIPRQGTGYGASFLFDEKAEVKASFVHKRLREYPVEGGASTLRESVRRDDIRDMAFTLLKALDWFGVAMVEFKVDPRDGIPKLMEVNPRFWGSLALAIESGVDFPYLLYRMSRGEKFQAVEEYEIGRRCRWVVPGDLLHFIYNPERMSLLPEFLNFWDGKTSHDVFSLRDPLPLLATILTPLTFLYDKDMQHRLKQRKILP
jgi:predicted ATP-grasp superfamily ATP-dependent carboligase